MSLDLGRRLLAAGAVQPGELQHALFEAVARKRPLARALVETSPSVRALLDRALEEPGHPAVRTVAPNPELVSALPEGLCARLLAVPLRKDPRTQTVDVALVDPLDGHAVAELSFHLRAPVRAVAAPLAEIEKALLLVDTRVKQTTADYMAIPRATVPEHAATVNAAAPRAEIPQREDEPDEVAMPLVRRARSSLLSPPPPSREAEAPQPAPAPPQPPSTSGIVPESRARVVSEAPTTNPFDRTERKPSRPKLTFDFGPSARLERDESPRREAPPRRKLVAKGPPFASLTPVLEAIDVASDREGLVQALLRGLVTTASCAALFAPRRGRFVGIGASGDLDADTVRQTVVPFGGAFAEAVGRGERLGAIDALVDVDLHRALDLVRFGNPHVLIAPAFVADRAALILVALGIGDFLEASRRARVLSTAASSALSRLLKR